MKQLMKERSGYYFEIMFDPDTREMRTNANIPFGMMSRGIGATLARMNITDDELDGFLLGLVKEYNLLKEEQNEQNKKND